MVAMEILQHRFGIFQWSPANIGKINTAVYDLHTQSGGKIIGNDNEWSENIKQALNDLSHFGRVSESHPGSDYWYISDKGQRILGKGEDWVYCYYTNSEKRLGGRSWTCKIGKTEKDSFREVREYIIKQTRNVSPDYPKIPLLFRTDRCGDLELAIQRTLKLRGKHINSAPGKELFTTNPEEVLQIYDFIIHQDPSYTAKQELENVAERSVDFELFDVLDL